MRATPLSTSPQNGARRRCLFIMRVPPRPLRALLLLLTLSTLLAQPLTQPTREDVLKSLKFRSIGPSIMGGRADDFAVVERNPDIVYAALAGGGIWKTVNGGITGVPIFDNEGTSGVGAPAIPPPHPSIVWAASGRGHNHHNTSLDNPIFHFPPPA